MHRRALFLLFTWIILVPHAYAQFSPGEPLSIQINPEYPRPYDVIQVTVVSQQYDLAGATTKLSVNGRLVTTYTGTESTPIQLGGPGEKTVISAVTTLGGKSYKKQITVATGDVALVTEADSTSHPFYMGGALVAPEGRIRILAIADLRTSKGVRLDPATLVYSWRFGTQALAQESGIGKSVLTAKAPLRYRDAQVSVIVTSQDGGVVGQASTVVQPVDPVLRIYATDPLLGTDFSRALKSPYQLRGAEESFRGVAYYFGGKPTFLWSVNGQGNTSDDTVTVRSGGSGAGRANLALSARLQDTRQSVTNTLSVLFGPSSKSSIFGF